MQAQHKPPNVLIIGNPGVGKSTMLNGVVGDAKFEAGVAMDGTGVTKHLQQCLHNGTNYVDTPGLDDDQSRKKCAEEIEKALKLGGLFYVCFVITLEAGRIRPNDKTTIRLVLDAAKQIGGQYSVIINKLEPKLLNAFQADPSIPKAILSRGFPDTIITNSLHFFPHEQALFDKDNAVFQPETVEGFLEFLKNAPAVQIDPPRVEKVKDEEWQVKFAEYEQTIKNLYKQMSDNQMAFQQAITEERKRLDEQMVRVAQQQAELERGHKAELERVRNQVEEAQRLHVQSQKDYVTAQQQHAAQIQALQKDATNNANAIARLSAAPPQPPSGRRGGCTLF